VLKLIDPNQKVGWKSEGMRRQTDHTCCYSNLHTPTDARKEREEKENELF
jgi:hypothetical protein